MSRDGGKTTAYCQSRASSDTPDLGPPRLMGGLCVGTVADSSSSLDRWRTAGLIGFGLITAVIAVHFFRVSYDSHPPPTPTASTKTSKRLSSLLRGMDVAYRHSH